MLFKTPAFMRFIAVSFMVKTEGEGQGGETLTIWGHMGEIQRTPQKTLDLKDGEIHCIAEGRGGNWRM